MIEALTALVLVLVAALVAERDRRRRDVAYWRAEALAAERDLRAATGSPRCPRRRPAQGCAGFTYTQTIPDDGDLAAWAMEVDGLPWRTWDWGMPAMDTTPDPASATPKVAPRVERSEAMTRACRRISTGELRELVYGGTA